MVTQHSFPCVGCILWLSQRNWLPWCWSLCNFRGFCCFPEGASYDSSWTSRCEYWG